MGKPSACISPNAVCDEEPSSEPDHPDLKLDDAAAAKSSNAKPASSRGSPPCALGPRTCAATGNPDLTTSLAQALRGGGAKPPQRPGSPKLQSRSIDNDT